MVSGNHRPCVNICNNNSWLLYKTFCKQMDIPNHSYRSLLQFRVEVANGLLLAKKTKEKAVGQPKKINFSPTLKVYGVPVEVKPLICAAIVLTTGPKSMRNERDTACVQH